MYTSPFDITMTLQALETWLGMINERHIVLGYGSLLNRDSRHRHSGIAHECIEAIVLGFQRGWVTRAYHEQQTYLGVWPDPAAKINVQLVPTSINPELRQRERDYRFVPVAPEQLEFSLSEQHQQRLLEWLADKSIWICETLEILPANPDYPVSQTYIDTCLAGCLQQGGEGSAHTFIATTDYWQHPRLNDRNAPIYPRYGNISRAERELIDTLLSGHK
jgi:hypothetical protein